MAKERKCIFCGQSYLYCPTCSEYQSYPKWMFNFDSEKCYDLYQVIGGYNMGIKTRDDVKAVLEKHNITDYSQFSSGLQKILNDLFPKNSRKKNNEIPEEVVENKSQKNNIEETDYFSRKRGRYTKKDYTEEAITEE